MVFDSIPPLDLIDFVSHTRHSHCESSIKKLILGLIAAVRVVHDKGVVIVDLRPEHMRVAFPQGQGNIKYKALYVCKTSVYFWKYYRIVIIFTYHQNLFLCFYFFNLNLPL
jgi:hypothetical protein